MSLWVTAVYNHVYKLNGIKSNFEMIRAVLMILLAFVTIFGNLLVIVAVLHEKILRCNRTNLLLVSLAIADLTLGSLVMPFAICEELSMLSSSNGTKHMFTWNFGRDWCDIWHALDVLTSTASILNLCAISIERYWAISDPISYPAKMTRIRTIWIICGVWICSSLISFPAIAWWRTKQVPNFMGDLIDCSFTDDRLYLFVSSCVSFYIPLIIMIILYYRIYRTAGELLRTLHTGKKIVAVAGTTVNNLGKDLTPSSSIVLRVHRGGMNNMPQTSFPINSESSLRKSVSDSMEENRTIAAPSITIRKSPYKHMRNFRYKTSQIVSKSKVPRFIQSIVQSSTMRRLRSFWKEQKAARTLGIVMGIFIMCWFPFIICNTCLAIEPGIFGENKSTLMSVVTWLGYANSCVNPFIYAYSMHEFRAAFLHLLTCGHVRINPKRFSHIRSRYMKTNIDYRLRLLDSSCQSVFVNRINVKRSSGHFLPRHMSITEGQNYVLTKNSQKDEQNCINSTKFVSQSDCCTH